MCVVLVVGLAFTVIVTARMSTPATDDFSEEECGYMVVTAGLVNGLIMDHEACFSATWVACLFAALHKLLLT